MEPDCPPDPPDPGGSIDAQWSTRKRQSGDSSSNSDGLIKKKQ